MKHKTKVAVDLLIGTGRVSVCRSGKYACIRISAKGLTSVEADRFVQAFGGSVTYSVHSCHWRTGSVADVARVCDCVIEHAIESQTELWTALDDAAYTLSIVRRYANSKRGSRTAYALAVEKVLGKSSVVLGEL